METYCPSSADLGWDYNNGGGQIFDAGWTIRGGARAHTTAAFNLLGGSVEFDYDVSGGHTGINNNLYTISPQLNGGAYTSGGQYCDGQAPDGKFCMELDIIESNGNCGGATTWHTQLGKGGGCDQNGCQAKYTYDGQTKMHVLAEFDTSGSIKVTVGGRVITNDQMNPRPDGAAFGTIVQVMKSAGVVLQSSQWQGWVPTPGSCPPENQGVEDEGGAVFSVSNLRIRGSVVSGPKPRPCGGLAQSSVSELNFTTVVL